MSKEDTYPEPTRLIRPEDIPTDRIAQQSVIKAASQFLDVIRSFPTGKSPLQELGLKFGGRILLIGPVGTDFDSFVYHLAVEVPVKLVLLQLSAVPVPKDEAVDVVRIGIEFAKRNSPALLYIPRLETVAYPGHRVSLVLAEEFSNMTWDDTETLIVATTAYPSGLDSDLLPLFDRVVTIGFPNHGDRIALFERAFKGRSDLDFSILAELTEGWGFADLLHLTASLLVAIPQAKTPFSHEAIEDMVSKSGVLPVCSRLAVHRLDPISKEDVTGLPDTAVEMYPDEFLDQLYLMAVSEDYVEMQRVIETLNSDSPLGAKDRAFLVRYPFLLSGSAEERLTRLLRAKKSRDRLSRMMGR